jgi:hypothetical protein
LTAIAGLANTDGNFIVGNGSTWVAESGSTARTSLGLGTIATQAASSVSITGGSITGITDLAVADGGTGASDAATARTNLGLGTISTQASSSVSITGGSISGITDLAITDGGTGASSASDARTNLGLAIGSDVPSPTGTGASGNWNINAATASAANNITNSGGWSVTPSGTTLFFSYNGTNVGKMDSSGNLTVIGNVTAYGTV